MKKIIAMVFVILFLLFQEVFAGGVFMDFEVTDKKNKKFRQRVYSGDGEEKKYCWAI